MVGLYCLVDSQGSTYREAHKELSDLTQNFTPNILLRKVVTKKLYDYLPYDHSRLFYQVEHCDYRQSKQFDGDTGEAEQERLFEQIEEHGEHSTAAHRTVEEQRWAQFVDGEFGHGAQ